MNLNQTGSLVLAYLLSAALPGCTPSTEPIEPVVPGDWIPLSVAGIEEELDDAQLVELAERYRVIGATHLSAEQRARLRELNPEVLLVKYQASVSVREDLLTAEQIEEWAMLDSTGNTIPSLNSASLIMLDPSSESLRAARVIQVQNAIEELGFDGIVFDEAAITRDGFYPGFAGFNDATNAVWEIEDFRAEQLENIQAIRDALPDIGLACNSIGNGTKTQAHLEDVVAFAGPCDGLLAEGYRSVGLNAPIDEVMSETEWLANVEMGTLVSESGSSMMAFVEISEDQVADEAAKAEFDLFHYATFLMGFSDGQLFSNTIEGTQEVNGGFINTPVFSAFQSINPGQPLGNYSADPGGGYTRNFENIVVVANPTESSVTFALSESLVGLDGTSYAVGDSLTLEAHRATLLLRE